jgi:ubiquinone/menaquinone biosynthesis C-methylase UbiE
MSTERPAAMTARHRVPLLLPFALLAAACDNGASDPSFPAPDRPVAPIVSTRYSNEDARDSAGEAETVMHLSRVAPGMTVADIGAGEGYYTVRLAPIVGTEGRVLAQDIVTETRDSLAERVQREALDNVSVKLGEADDPKLPPASFDRIFMVHMYHEIEQPYAFLWHMRPALKRGGSVVVVDADRPTANHGTPPRLLVCEFAAVGYKLVRFEDLPAAEAYLAQFVAHGERPDPAAIRACQD